MRQAAIAAMALARVRPETFYRATSASRSSSHCRDGAREGPPSYRPSMSRTTWPRQTSRRRPRRCCANASSVGTRRRHYQRRRMRRPERGGEGAVASVPIRALFLFAPPMILPSAVLPSPSSPATLTSLAGPSSSLWSGQKMDATIPDSAWPAARGRAVRRIDQWAAPPARATPLTDAISHKGDHDGTDEQTDV